MGKCDDHALKVILPFAAVRDMLPASREDRPLKAANVTPNYQDVTGKGQRCR